MSSALSKRVQAVNIAANALCDEFNKEINVYHISDLDAVSVLRGFYNPK